MGLSFLSQFAFALLACFFLLPSFNSQQQYVQNGNLACENQTSVSKGYFCNGIKKSCISFLTFRSNQLYDSPQAIASLLGSEALTVASINNVSVSTKFPADELIRVPISCDCWGSMYQHNTSYTVKPGDTYFTIANNTYQGLTSCQALVGQNYFESDRISSDAELMIPLRCACPTQSQSANGVIALITYLITWGDTLSSIAEKFRVDPKGTEEANQMDGGTMIFPFTPILLPVRSESCGGNTTGNPLCQCPNGLYAYQMPDGHTCTAQPSKDGKGFPLKLVAILGVTIGVALLCVAVVGYWLWLYLWKRKDMIRREKLFKQNGGLMLEQRLSSYGGGEKAKIFAAEELEKATDNFNQSRILGQGGYGTVYKGMLPNGIIVAIKRSKAIDRTQIQQFINEVVILSHINHRNIVRLLGCCLETEFPLLVYEFIPNGTLYNHIHNHDPECMFLWDDRFRIACEVAGAVAYMHSAASTPVFHRDIKPSNILLDERHSAKVSDFGTSRSIPNDKTHLTTDVQGTFGYLDPEYFQSSMFTDKSDVYSFGVVLVELLTGEKPVSLTRIEEGRNLVAHFISLVKDKRLVEIIDPRICEEWRIEDFYAVANIAVRCLRLNGKKRPTMKEVVLELERLKNSQTCLQVHQVSELIGDDDEQSRQGFEEESFDLPFDLESTYF